MWTGILGEPTLSRVLPRNLKLWGELPAAAGRAFLIAKDAVGNVIELLDGPSPMAYHTVRQCEQELDDLESDIDEKLPHAITRVSEARARGLLASLRFITELERVGDLMLGVANRLRLPSNCMPPGHHTVQAHGVSTGFHD